jgi:putative aldouronate transport system permease protein
MYFSAGTIPDYLNMDNLNLLDTVWVLILPGLFSAYNMIILRTFMQNSIPESLIEAAELDGCDDFRILFQVVLPLSKSVLATLALFYAVGRWNGYSDALYYIQSENLKPLQLKLYQLVSSSASASLQQEGGGGEAQSATEVVKAATIMFATIPIVIVYPFVQKYFVSGVMIGAVKG